MAVLTVAAALAPRPAVPNGLTGRYFGNATWSGAPLLERVDADISTAALAARPELAGLSAFSVEWTGALVVRESGLQRIATKTDDGSWLWIDEQLIIDNGGAHPLTNRTGEVFLARGVHAIRLRYAQEGGSFAVQLGRAGGHGTFSYPGPLIPIAVSYAEFRAREAWPLALVLLWYAVLVWVAWLVSSRLLRLPPLQGLADAAGDRAFMGIALLGLAAAAAHIAYGLPSYQSLSSDELPPLGTLLASQSDFRGWNLRWPPLHLYTIAMVLQPFAWAERWLGLSMSDVAVHATMTLVVRALSVAMLYVTLLLTFDAARRLFDRAAGYAAVALLASMPIVTYFGGLANLEVPQLCWSTFAFWSWLTFARLRTEASALVFGAAIGLSLACKDQLYGFYVAAPLAVLYIVGRERPRGGGFGLLAALRDRRTIMVGLAAIAGFAVGHQLPMEWRRFAAHVNAMVGVSSEPFRVFDHSLAGHWNLLTTTVTSFVWAAGVPAACASAAGAIYLVRAGRPRLLGALLLPLVTYYVTFLVVILYVYDRFLIAFLPVAAIVGGAGLSALLRSTWPRALRMAVPALLFGAAALNAIGINVVFQRDPRHEAGQWLAAHAACGSTIGVTYDVSYVPPLVCYEVWSLLPSQTENLTRLPDYFVLNEAFARRFLETPSGSKFLARLASGELGYHRVFRAEARPPRWAPLYWEARFHNAQEDVETVLDKPLHAIEVWTR